jgi:hypothetical protein
MRNVGLSRNGNRFPTKMRASIVGAASFLAYHTVSRHTVGVCLSVEQRGEASAHL